MKITVAIDSFKGSLTTKEAEEAVTLGILRALPTAEIKAVPIADGGEGTTDTIVTATHGTWRHITVKDPLFRKIGASYGVINGGKTAVIEMASASGLTLVEKGERNPLNTTTLGTGEMIRDAIECGIRDFLIGIGGSATNDGGVGMLVALGARFLKADGEEITPTGGGLCELSYIDVSKLMPEIAECRFRVACDVKNPLVGKDGCSAVYAPQKGASLADIIKMDAALLRYATLTKGILKNADENAPGAGAAGGLGYALLAYLGAELMSGVDLVIRAVGLEACVRESDLVITGEGRFDGQSVMGKVPVGVARLAKKYEKPVIALAGAVADGAEICREWGVDAIFPAVRTPISLDDAMDKENAKKNLALAAREALEAVKIGLNMR